MKGIAHNRTKYLNNLKSLRRHTPQTVIDVKRDSPRWLQMFLNMKEEFQDIQGVSNDLQTLEVQRAKMVFGDASQLDSQIQHKNQQLTKSITRSQENIEILAKLVPNSVEEYKIIHNMRQQLATQLRELTQKIRLQQRRFIQLRERQCREDGGGFLKIKEEKQVEIELGLLEPLQTQDRQKDIDQLVRTVTDLSQVFQSLNEVIIDQGSIIDRIDYNISLTHKNVVMANRELRIANTSQSSSLSNNCILIQVLLIFLFSMFLTAKYSKY